MSYSKREKYNIGDKTYIISMVSNFSYEIINIHDEILFMGDYTECKDWLQKKTEEANQ